MKLFFNILNRVREWPEERRRFVALGLIIAAAIFLFVSWTTVVSTQLSYISGNTSLENMDFFVQPPSLGELPKSNETSASYASPVSSPLSGLWESVRPLGKKTVEIMASFNFLSFGKDVSASLASLPRSFMKRLDIAADFAAEKLR